VLLLTIHALCTTFKVVGLRRNGKILHDEKAFDQRGNMRSDEKAMETVERGREEG
jgi:hypothetical protein